MRKISLTALVYAAMLLFVYGQADEIINVSHYLSEYGKNPGDGSLLAKAKKEIDGAMEKEDLKNDPQAWYYRGRTYLAISNDKDRMKELDTNSIEKAFLSFLTCIELDKENTYKDKAPPLLIAAAIKLYNVAVVENDRKHYEKAFLYYNYLFDAFPYDKEKALFAKGITPESVNDDLYGIEKRSGNKEKARKYLEQLVNAGYQDPVLYIDLSHILLEEQDTVKALSCIEKGRGLFSDNIKIINAEMNVYIAKGQAGPLLDKINKAIGDVPKNEVLYFMRGTIYEKRGNASQAEDAYKKAVELKPDYYDAIYNLGKLYFGVGTEWSEKANNTPAGDSITLKEYDAKTKEAFQKTIPYYEQLHTLNPTDASVFFPLLRMYKETGNKEKYDKLKKEQKQLNANKK